jgi:arylformamidase
MAVYDVSAPLGPDLPSWPGNAGFQRDVVASFGAGDGVTLSEFSFSAHTGTHMDAPCHFIEGGAGIEALAMDSLYGPAQVIGLEHLSGPITAASLDGAGIPVETQRLLAKTRNSGWSRSGAGFQEDFIALDASAAQWCVENGIRLIGIDYLSIEPFGSGKNGYPTHKTLLGAGVVILEGLDLAGVTPGFYSVAALPLLVPGSDGAPARVILLD